uniref:Thiol-disulfide oxidoreductase DCC n=1 Tax=Grammatophora oceanica TaxID=210454 RepID=A0A7S1Y6T2_9STRA|mmetsp:Transcript_31471/g.46705  ORF Transcript_31471/g.46705 Transcript_31471/m.46705 type:complete len:223 (+) Transcript_31471:76-744(+)
MRVSFSSIVLMMVPTLTTQLLSKRSSSSLFVQSFVVLSRHHTSSIAQTFLEMSATTSTSAEGASTSETAVDDSSSSPSATRSPVQLTNPVILYDGVCNFCNTWVDIMLRIDRKAIYKFAPLQSSVGKDLLVQVGREAEDISSVILVEKDGATFYDKSDVPLQVVKELGPLAKAASLAATKLLPLSARNSIYDLVAENRYRLLGKRTECRCSDPEFADRFLLD